MSPSAPTETSAAAPAPPDPIRAVPVRHPGRWAAMAAIAVLAAMERFTATAGELAQVPRDAEVGDRDVELPDQQIDEQVGIGQPGGEVRGQRRAQVFCGAQNRICGADVLATNEINPGVVTGDRVGAIAERRPVSGTSHGYFAFGAAVRGG